MTKRAKPKDPTATPGPAVKWETIVREYDKDDRLVSERITVVTDTSVDPPKAALPFGFRLGTGS